MGTPPTPRPDVFVLWAWLCLLYLRLVEVLRVVIQEVVVVGLFVVVFVGVLNLFQVLGLD